MCRPKSKKRFGSCIKMSSGFSTLATLACEQWDQSTASKKSWVYLALHHGFICLLRRVIRCLIACCTAVYSLHFGCWLTDYDWYHFDWKKKIQFELVQMTCCFGEQIWPLLKPHLLGSCWLCSTLALSSATETKYVALANSEPLRLQKKLIFTKSEPQVPSNKKLQASWRPDLKLPNLPLFFQFCDFS